MIDLETLGLRTDSLILSIGACEFDPMTGDIGAKLELNIDMQSGIDAGRTIDKEVLDWWMTQPEEARNHAFSGTIPFDGALISFRGWMPENAYIWGNGPTFDVAKLESAYENMFGVESYPWKFYNVRCVRTIRDLTKGVIDRDEVPFDGEKHTALADAIWQAKYVSIMYKTIREKFIV